MWFKAQSYRLDKGKLEPCGNIEKYDPWEQYDLWRKGEEGIEPPYLKLMNTLNELIYSPGELSSIYNDLISKAHRAEEKFKGSEMAKAVLDCCNETGLLGMLPRNLSSFRNKKEGERGTGYRWSPSGWREGQQDGILVSGHPPAHWDDFFDESSKEAIGCAPPLSEAFMASYREPVIDFVSGAVQLLNIVRALFEPLPDDTKAAEAIDNLNAFIVSAKPFVVRRADGSMFNRWVTPSLIDAYALMISMDTIMVPRRTVVCGNCGKLFIPSDKRANFCDARCQNTGNKKLTRKRQAMSRKLAAEGLTPEEIAQKVQSTPDAVLRWVESKK